MAIAARMPMMMITISNSISVKPFFLWMNRIMSCPTPLSCYRPLGALVACTDYVLRFATFVPLTQKSCGPLRQGPQATLCGRRQPSRLSRALWLCAPLSRVVCPYAFVPMMPPSGSPRRLPWCLFRQQPQLALATSDLVCRGDTMPRQEHMSRCGRFRTRKTRASALLSSRRERAPVLRRRDCRPCGLALPAQCLPAPAAARRGCRERLLGRDRAQHPRHGGPGRLERARVRRLHGRTQLRLLPVLRRRPQLAAWAGPV